MAIQRENSELVDLLTSEFQRRYEPNFAWANAVAAHLMLPGLRGLWPMSSLDENGDAFDLSGQGRTLDYNGNPVYGTASLAPYIDFDGVGDFLRRADEAGLDILGTEAYVAAPGITFGCWVYLDAITPANDQYVMGKQNGVVAASISYSIKNPAASSVLRFSVSSGLAAETQDTAAIAAQAWYHVIARWSPTRTGIFLDGVLADAATALAAINNTGAWFVVGGRDDGGGGVTRLMAGRVSLAFLCCYALPDVLCTSLFHVARALFNK